MTPMAKIQAALLVTTRAKWTALAASNAKRIYPIYRDFWVGDYLDEVERASNAAWDAACGKSPDPAVATRDLVAIESLVEFYNEDGLGLLASVTTAALNALVAATAVSDPESALAAARTCGNVLHAARIVDGLLSGVPNTPGHALLEESQRHDRAMVMVARSNTVVERSMFDSIENSPPLWWPRFVASPRHNA